MQTVVGDTIEFIEQPPENSFISKNSIAKEHAEQVNAELNSLLDKHVIVPCDHEPGEFISPIFSVPKKDNRIRLILNLKNLNQYVQYHHFKMDSIHTALQLVTQDCWMASIDLKDAYYSVKVHDEFRKYLKFCYKNRLYKYTAYPNGLSHCPRKFTKLLKPLLCSLRKNGHILCVFIDDLLLVATSYEGCCSTVMETIQSLDMLGFTVHPEKSVFLPQKQITFLGFDINSTSMKITLTKEKIRNTLSIREVAQVIGYIVASLPAVRYGQCDYRAIEKDKIDALKQEKGTLMHKCIYHPKLKHN